MRYSLSIFGFILIASTVVTVPAPQGQSIEQINESSGINALNDNLKNTAPTAETGSLEHLGDHASNRQPFGDNEKREAQPEPTANSNSSSTSSSAATSAATHNATNSATASAIATPSAKDLSQAYQAQNEAIIAQGTNKRSESSETTNLKPWSFFTAIEGVFSKRQGQSVSQALQSSGINNIKNNTNSNIATGELAKASQAAMKPSYQVWTKRDVEFIENGGLEARDDESLEHKVQRLESIIKRQSQSLDQVMQSSGINDLNKNLATHSQNVETGSLLGSNGEWHM